MPYSEAVAWVELRVEELAARVGDVDQLEEVGGLQKRLHVVLVDFDARRVRVVHQRHQRLRVHVHQRDAVLVLEERRKWWVTLSSFKLSILQNALLPSLTPCEFTAINMHQAS